MTAAVLYAHLDKDLDFINKIINILRAKKIPLQNRIVKLSESANLTSIPSGVSTRTPKNAIRSPFR